MFQNSQNQTQERRPERRVASLRPSGSFFNEKMLGNLSPYRKRLGRRFRLLISVRAPRRFRSRLATTHPQRALRHKSLVPPCFVNQLLDRFACSVNDRSRSNVSSFDGRHAQEKGRRPSRWGSARPGQSLSPHCRSQSTRSAERKSVIHVSGRFCWVKANGQWLLRWMLWRPNRRAQIPSALRSAKPIRWRIR
jgi:hypothetical protein